MAQVTWKSVWKAIRKAARRSGGAILAGLLVTPGFAPPAEAKPPTVTPDQSRKVRLGAREFTVRVSRFDLSDPQVMIQLAFARGQAHPSGPEAFAQLARRAGGAVAVNGTFFNVRTYETFGNLVTGGQLVQHRAWDDRGTALVIGRDRRGRLHPLREAGWPDYQDSWLILPAGPRLLDHGQIALNPRREGFQDPVLYRRKARTALGLSQEGKSLWVVTIRQEVTLREEAAIMQGLGVSEALNLDGGTSVGLAVGGTTRVHPRTPLTHALVVYDARHPAPRALQARYASWLEDASRTAPGPQGDPVRQP